MMLGIQMNVIHECGFEDVVSIAPGCCKTIFIPICDSCKKRTEMSKSEIDKYTGGDRVFIKKNILLSMTENAGYTLKRSEELPKKGLLPVLTRCEEMPYKKQQSPVPVLPKVTTTRSPTSNLNQKQK